MGFTMNGTHAVYTAGQKIYTEDAAKMREDFKTLLEKGQKNFVVDFTGTDYIDSSGLGVLVGIQKRAMEISGSVKIAGLKGNVKEIFELTRLTRVFDIYNTVREI